MKCLGIDVGKKQDPSAMTMIEGNGVKHSVVAAQALPLNMPYDELVTMFQVSGKCADMVLIDCGGPGWPVIDMLRSNGMTNVWAVAITSGKRIIASEEHKSINVPKTSLISNLLVHWEKNQLALEMRSISPADRAALVYEMNNFVSTLTDAGSLKMEAKRGHDDIVLSAALAMLGFRIREFLA